MARAMVSTVDTLQREPFHQHPAPGAAAIDSPIAGKYAAPANTFSPSHSATSEPHSGVPRTKVFVPSMGSMIHRRFAPGRSSPNSSPSKPSSGKYLLTHSRAAVSAARSAIVTGEPSAFHSTLRFVR